jgi:radical SAM superfamily enzyme YgiQ (UPF0313 family)
MIMKILLVLPASDRVRVTRDNPKVPKRNMLRFSILPLTTVAALTPPEHQVRICDENVEALDFNAEADVVGITFMTALAPRAYKIAAAFRGRGKIVVAGGFHPTFLPEEAAQHVDAVVVGEAEGSWPKVLEDIKARRLQRIYRRTSPCDPSEIPIPRRDLTSQTACHYVTTNAVQGGRGCLHACRYCSITAFHRQTYRSRPLTHVLEELRQIPRNFMFVDDNIIADREYAKALFRAMIPMRKRWVSQCSIEIADDRNLLHLARQAGCIGLFIGIETLSEENLAAVEKEFNDSRGYRHRIKVIRREGIGIVAGIIVGMDGDGPGSFQRMLRFLEKARVDAVQVNIMTPLPGTPLFEEYRRQGRILDQDWSHYDFRHTVIQPAHMTARQLQDGADWLYSQFYRLDRILLRFLRATLVLGWVQALVGLRLNLTYRYDNLRERIIGQNPAVQASELLGAAIVRKYVTVTHSPGP